MAEIDFTDIEQGISVGIQRADIDIVDHRGVDPKLQDNLGNVLTGWPENLSPRFVRYFSEMSAIASISRRSFNFPDLDIPDIRAYLGVCAFFFDSFRHK